MTPNSNQLGPSLIHLLYDRLRDRSCRMYGSLDCIKALSTRRRHLGEVISLCSFSLRDTLWFTSSQMWKTGTNPFGPSSTHCLWIT